MSVLSDSQPVRPDDASLTERGASLRQHLSTGIERWRSQWQARLIILAVFLGFYYLPVGQPRFDGAVVEALAFQCRYFAEDVAAAPAGMVAAADAACPPAAPLIQQTQRRGER